MTNIVKSIQLHTQTLLETSSKQWMSRGYTNNCMICSRHALHAILLYDYITLLLLCLKRFVFIQSQRFFIAKFWSQFFRVGEEHLFSICYDDRFRIDFQIINLSFENFRYDYFSPTYHKINFNQLLLDHTFWSGKKE